MSCWIRKRTQKVSALRNQEDCKTTERFDAPIFVPMAG